MAIETVQSDLTQPPSPSNFAKPGALLAGMGALLLAMNELSNLSGQFLTESGGHATLGQLGGPTAFAYRAHWRDQFDDADKWCWILGSYVVLDLAYIAVYALALLAVVDAVFGRVGGRRHWTARLVWALAAVDVFEDLLWLVAGPVIRGMGNTVPTWMTFVLCFVTTVKWLFVAGLAVVALVVANRRAGTVARRSREVGNALFLQRFSLLAFLPVAALTVLPLAQVNNLFDQMPDVQRAWLDSGTGLAHLLLAGAAFVVVVLPGIFWLGRFRADWAYRRVIDARWPNYDPPTTGPGGGQVPGPARKQHLEFWLAGPAVLVVLAVLVATVWDGTVFWRRLVVFCAVPVVIVVASWVMRARGFSDPEELPDRTAGPSSARTRFSRDAMAVGDIVTVAAISLTGFGLIRAFTGETALWVFGMLPLGVRHHPWQWPILLLVLGFVLAILPWLLAYPTLLRLDEAGRVNPGRLIALAAKVKVRDRVMQVLQPGRDVYEARGEVLEPVHARGVVSLVFLGVWTALFLTLAASPRWWAYEFPGLGFGVGFGVLGAAILAIGSLTLMVGSLMAYAQRSQPPELLQRIRIVPRIAWLKRLVTGSWGSQTDTRRFRSWLTTPVISVLAVAVTAATIVGHQTDVHPVAGTGTIPARPTMDQAFAAWLAQPDACQVPYAGHDGMTIRPMVMYGAEGGGIRATYWTDSALQIVASAGDGCGRSSALLSGGASGGAFGLTLARFDSDPGASVKAVNGPDALAVASVSLAAGDSLASAAGIRFAASTPYRTPDPETLDRAGLMETALEARWEHLRQGRDSHQTLTAEEQREPLFLPGTPTIAPTISGTGAPGTADDVAAVTGQLVLTSTSAHDGCRALLSQLDLSGRATAGTWPGCGGGDAGKDSFDLFNAYSKAENPSDSDPEGGTDHCLGNVPALTAGLLASRFPYVTPSGVVGPCQGLPPLQLIDGGYSDNTGLGTITGLEPLWDDLVRDHNDAVLRAGKGQLIVPTVVYLDNGSGGDYSVTDIEIAAEDADIAEQAKSRGHWFLDPRGIPEPLIPPVGGFFGAAHKIYPNRELSSARGLIQKDLCTGPQTSAFSSATPAQLACQDLRQGPGNKSVFVVHQRPQPSVSAPLGWELSDASMADLDDDIAYQADHRVDQTQSDPAFRAGGKGYGSLCDLLLYLGLGEAGHNTSDTASGAGQAGCTPATTE